MYRRCKSSTQTGPPCGQDSWLMESSLKSSLKTWFIRFPMITLTCAHWQRRTNNFCGNVRRKDSFSRPVWESCHRYTEPPSTPVGIQPQFLTCTCPDHIQIHFFSIFPNFIHLLHQSSFIKFTTYIKRRYFLIRFHRNWFDFKVWVHQRVESLMLKYNSFKMNFMRYPLNKSLDKISLRKFKIWNIQPREYFTLYFLLSYK